MCFHFGIAAFAKVKTLNRFFSPLWQINKHTHPLCAFVALTVDELCHLVASGLT